MPEIFPFYVPPQKVAGYYVIPSELLSVCPSVRPSVRQRLNIRVRSIPLIPLRRSALNIARDIPLLCPATKSGGVLCYTLRTFECLSVRPSVRPSEVEHSCPLHTFDTVRDNFTKLGTNINHDQTTCRD